MPERHTLASRSTGQSTYRSTGGEFSMSDSGITINDRATLIDPNAPPFVGRPVIYYSFLDSLPDLLTYSPFTNYAQYFGASAGGDDPYYSSFNAPENALAKADVKAIFDILGSMLNVQF